MLREAGVDDKLLQVPDERMTNVRLMCQIFLKWGNKLFSVNETDFFLSKPKT